MLWFLKAGIILNRKGRATYMCCTVYWGYVYTVWVTGFEKCEKEWIERF
jgi:hypothetical protein